MDSTFPDIFSPLLQCPGGIVPHAHHLHPHSSMERNLDGNAKSVSSVTYCSQGLCRTSGGLPPAAYNYLLCSFQETLLLLTEKLSMPSFLFRAANDQNYHL